MMKCNREDCIWNNKEEKISGTCARDEILVDKATWNGEEIWSCRCFSQEKISGHMDWSRFPQGGHIDDSAAEKMYQDGLKFKSFPWGHKESKEKRRKSK